MSATTIQIIENRIKVATKESPIAVFVSDGQLKSMFAALENVKADIKSNKNLIGVYDQSMDIKEIHNELMQAERGL